MKKTRILYWTPEFYPEIGGIEEISRRTLPYFQKLNHDFLVITSHGRLKLPDLSDFNGIPVHRFDFRRVLQKNDLKKILEYQKQISNLKKEFNPDLIHYHFGDPYSFFHLTTANSVNAPTIVTLHMNITDYYRGPDGAIDKLLKMSSWVVGVSMATLKDAKKLVPDISVNSSVIYNGIEPPEPTNPNLNFNTPNLLCIGRVREEKGFDTAITALKKIHKKFKDCRLTIAGDGIELNNLKKLTSGLKLNKSVNFLGWVDPKKIPDVINQSTIVVIPTKKSWREPFPLVALEASSYERPIVASNVGGLPEFIIHKKTGILFESENDTKLADSVLYLLQNPKTAITYGKNGRKRIENEFTIKKYVENYDNLYKKILTN